MIYFLRHVETGLIKIGKADSFEIRYNELVKQYGELEPIGFVKGGKGLESSLHRVFKRFHIIGILEGTEWFQDCESIRVYIKSVGQDTPIEYDVPIYIKWDIVSDDDIRNKNVEFSNRIQDFCIEVINQTDMSQRKLAALLEIETSVLSRIITGKATKDFVSFSLVDKICHIFNVKPNDLLLVNKAA